MGAGSNAKGRGGRELGGRGDLHAVGAICSFPALRYATPPCLSSQHCLACPCLCASIFSSLLCCCACCFCREYVHSMCVIDPVALGMFMPHLLHNFMYR